MEFREGALPVDDPECGRIVVEGDGYAAAGELVTLVVVAEVLRCLGLMPDQVSELARVVADYRAALSRLARNGEEAGDQAVARVRADSEREIERIVGPAVTARLRRLSWRIRNGDALLDPDVSASLELAPETQQALVAARQENRRIAGAANREISRARFVTQGVYGEHALTTHQGADERLLALLTSDQRAAFERLKRGR